MKIVGMIGSLIVAAIGLLMIASFFNGDVMKPPVLSGIAFTILGVTGLLNRL